MLLLQVDRGLYQIPFVFGRREPADLINVIRLLSVSRLSLFPLLRLIVHPLAPAQHSCDPSCFIRGQVALVAGRDLGVDDEVTFDYSTAAIDEDDFEFDCECGVACCRKK